MGKLIISTNMTLDGIGQDPTGDEGHDFGGWYTQISESDREAWAKLVYEECLTTDAVLVGGRSYEWFASRWIDREGPWAERLNGQPKYVVRSPGGRTDWGPTTEISDDIVAGVTAAKEAVAGDLVVFASYQLVPTLLNHDLVDEIRLFVFPHVLGRGGRVFTELSANTSLRLVSANTVGDSLVHLTYGVGPAGSA